MDAFDFDDEEDRKSPPSSPEVVEKKTVKPAAAATAPKLPPPSTESNTTSAGNNSSQTSSSSTIASPPSATGTNGGQQKGSCNNDPLKGGRTRHARYLAKKQEKEENRKPQHEVSIGREENNGYSPSKQVRFLRDLKNKRCIGDDSNDADTTNDDNFSAASSSILSSLANNNSSNGAVKNKQQPPRKRRRKQQPVNAKGNTKKKMNTKLIQRRTQKTDECTSSTSPFDGCGGSCTMSPRLSSSMKNNNGVVRASTSSHLSLSEQIQRKLHQHERRPQEVTGGPNNHHQETSPTVIVSRKVRGAGRDVYALQDAGTFQMIQDECAYLTSTITSCPTGHSVPTKAGMVESVSELAVLLSNTKSRRILWEEATTTSSSSRTSHQGNNNNALEGILSVLRHTTMALAEKSNSNHRFFALHQKLQLAPTTTAKEGDDHDPEAQLKAATTTVQCHRRHINIVETYYRGLLLDSLAAIVSFLSWDCTIENRESAYYQNASGARTLRKTILQYDGALSAILYIIRHADPMVSSILEAQRPPDLPHENELNVQPPQATCQGNNNDNSQSTHGGAATAEFPIQYGAMGFKSSSALSDFQADPASSPSKSVDGRSSVASSHDADSVSSAVTDPTAAGRLKRRRKRGAAALEPIAEDGSFALSFTGGNAATTTNDDFAISSPLGSPPRRVVFQKPETGSDARTKLSFTSEDALTMSPPRSPLRQRGGVNSPVRTNDKDDGSSSMVSCDSTLLKIHDQIGKARSRFILPSSEKQQHQTQLHASSWKPHHCQGHRELPLSFGGKDPAGSAASMTLKALHRLLDGKEEGDAHCCLDDVEEDSNVNSNNDDEDMLCGNQSETAKKAADEDELLRNNPLLQTNRILDDSGVIPTIALGVAETLTAALVEIDQEDCCQACLHYLHGKFQELALVVDNATLLHDENRVEFCSASTADDDSSGILIGCLILFVKRWLHQTPQINSNRAQHSMISLLNEMGLFALRTLTSLTHDNILAAEQMVVKYLDDRGPPSSCWNGVQIIGQVLYRAANTKSENPSKIDYDTRILCLNTLANIVGDEPRGDIRRLLVSMKWPSAQVQGGSNGKTTIYFLSWLTHWIVGLTESFRDAIMKGSFGGANNNKSAQDPNIVSSSSSINQQHSDRELEKHEHEQLVTAGNGCVLLACLLMDPPKTNHNKAENDVDNSLRAVTQRIREMILSEMPLLDEAGGRPSGTTFLQNTLRAFSNFLYYSVGDLSVAVVAPVRNLISGLEKIQVEVIS